MFSEIYQRYSEPKTRRRAFSILENAATLFDKKGFENVTFLMIARESALTPQTIRHYFTDLAEIHEMSIKYIHLIAQHLIVDEMEGAQGPAQTLERYLQAHGRWAAQYKGHLRVWISFLSSSSRRKKDRRLNTEAILVGAERIQKILKTGREAKVFHHADDFLTARALQAMILGWLTTTVTEELPDEEGYGNVMIQRCLEWVLKP